MLQTSSLHVLILAGGLGTRLRSVVNDRPKVLAEVGGRPFVTYLLDRLIDDGLSSVTLLTGYKSQMLEERLGYTYKSMQLGFSVEDKPLGTGGAVRAASRVIACDQLLVLNGDTFFDVSYTALAREVKPGTDLVTCRKVSDVGRYGAVRLEQNGQVLSMAEKEQTGPGIINGGTYILERKQIATWHMEVFSLEKDYFPAQIKSRRLYGLACDGAFIDIGIPNDLERAGDILP